MADEGMKTLLKCRIAVHTLLRSEVMGSVDWFSVVKPANCDIGIG